jgi:peroxiredoxin
VAKDLNGFPVGSAALRGKVLFLDFGATTQPLWCQQTTNLLAAYKKFHSQGFEVITVSLDESPAKIAEFARAQGLPWRVVCDGREWAGTLALKYGLAMLPSNLIIDRYGSIFTRTVAASEFDAAITKALAYKKPAVKIIPGTNLPAAKSAPAPAKK